MSLDLTTISPQARTSYIHIGRQYSSPDTLAQANQTLHGLSLHGASLVVHGFSVDDGQQLLDARDALVAAGVGRSEARNDKKVAGATYLAAMTGGKACRETARSVLAGTRRALHEQSTPEAEAGVKVIDAALSQTRVTPVDDADKLAEQLDVLRGAFANTSVAAAAQKRGGPEAVTELADRATALREASAGRAGVPGTRAHTEQLDLIDGIIVSLARNAQKAARAAARRLGKPALAAEFELTKLYTQRQGKTPDAAEDAPAPAPAVV